MIPWLLQHLIPLAEQMEQHTVGNSRVNLTARAALAAVTSFLAAVLFGPIAIRWLQGRFRERIDSASQTLNKLHANKKGTPTMGGLFIMASVVTASLIWADLSNRYVQIGLFIAVAFAALGATDDWVKLSTSKRGLSARQKFVVQWLLAFVAATWLYFEQKDKPHGLELLSPITTHAMWLGLGLIPWAAFVIVSTSNGVNLTDGLDGLATGCSVFAGTAFVALTYLAGHSSLANYLNIPFMPGSGELSIVIGSLVGAMMGFLWFNCYPAQVFMGDTGSLPIGALLALAALVTRQEVLLVIIGGVFVIETLSVILQVSCYRLTGKRLIACSPLHNHFVFRGVHEIKIVTRFWIGSAVLAILGMVTLKIQ
ncbi:phospho-N-acetylmuramoyl-pentapeptide-transferase [Planctomicrobium piriforme]|uniref:Phospho-N-acetylmuramoyl-pentapeptide-transferase n=1 Tax=Planctomicrobium piriforme TaxID=1576369 RepID=A0A1I3T8Q4_9PLAN|nr:phospho-N-acetylmuramoyl-pentapeptide-transferase [Planctomicrobium piriforme]SFJ67444.1 phospho-N-acetylmuramoyl-pentapeptide-transferase [Planctomicrobium piriforme]